MAKSGSPTLRRRLIKLVSLTAVLFFWCASSSRAFAELSADEVFKQVSPSIVRIECEHQDGSKTNLAGFACYMEITGFIMTSSSAMGRPKSIRVGVGTNDMIAVPVTDAFRNYTLGLTVLIMPAELYLPLLQLSEKPPGSGERAYVLPSFSNGTISALVPVSIDKADRQELAFIPPVAPGLPGGPVIDQAGKVIGVVGLEGKKRNGAISTAGMPNLATFRPIVYTVTDALTEVLDLQKLIADLTEKLKIGDLHHYLMQHWWRALDHNPEPLSEFEAAQQPRLRSILSFHKNLNHAVDTAEAVIMLQHQLRGTIPLLFQDLPNGGHIAAYLTDFYKNIRRPSHITASEITPLLAESMKLLNSRAEDYRNQILYLSDFLPELKADPAKFRDIYFTVKEQGYKRRQKHIDYEKERRATRTYGEITQLFLESLVEPESTTLELSRKMTIQEFNAAHGGLEVALSLYFAKMAEQHLKQGDAAKALSLLKHEAAHKRHPDVALHGFALICDGQFEQAYTLFQTEVLNARPVSDPFIPFGFSAVRSRTMALNALLEPNFGPVAENLDAQLKKYPEFLSKKPWHNLVVSSAKPQEIFSSPEFVALDKFGQITVVYAVEKRIGKGDKPDKEVFVETVKQFPAAHAAYEQLYTR